MKLNIGSADKKIDGFLNIDGNDADNVDAIGDLGEVPYIFTVKDPSIWDSAIRPYTMPGGEEGFYIFANDAFDEVLAVEFLEHISFRKTDAVLQEWERILKPGGVVSIQVPDCGKAMEYYVNDEVCECVPHKSVNGDANGDFKADPNCFVCGGKAKINPIRWLYSFTGAQKHKYDAHLNIFDKTRMEEYLLRAGFTNIEFSEHPYKVKVKAVKAYV